ncbi:MAG: hypothetical protein ACRDZQ_03485, partial [Acidimicrobiales bacterium]
MGVEGHADLDLSHLVEAEGVAEPGPHALAGVLERHARHARRVLALGLAAALVAGGGVGYGVAVGAGAGGTGGSGRAGGARA